MSDIYAADQTDEQDDRDKEPSSLDKAVLLKKLKAWFGADNRHSAKWRREAKEDFGFVAGDQWSQQDKAYMAEQQRAPIVFNRTLTILKSVAGTEINGRQQIQYLPRGNEDTAVNEVLTAGSMWMSDGCDAEDEQSEAFQHALICGMGWTEARVDFEEDAQGKYIEECIDPLEMYWDCKSRKKNTADKRRVWRVRRVSLPEARAMFPNVLDDDDLDATWVMADSNSEPKSREQKLHQSDRDLAESYDDEVTIVQGQWWERETYWKVADPNTGQMAEFDNEQYGTLSKRAKELGFPLKAAKMTRRVYKQAFIGKEILEVGDAPCKDHFSWNCITGEFDRNNGTWFGFLRVMRDPQMWANKWLSQTLHILNSTAKGGIIAETTAFEDQKQAEATYARPEGISWASEGAISKGKIMAKPGATIPAGYMQLMEFAISSIRDVTGVNLELLGLRDANQPGILEAQRKQAAMTVLATAFDSLRRFRKMVGRIRLYFLQEFFSDGRLIRVVGPMGAKAMPLLKDRTLGEYDVIVDDAPSAPNQKEQNWALISQMLPAFKDQLAAQPELMMAVMEYSPLPSALLEKLKAVSEAPNPEKEQQKQLAQRAAMATIGKDEATALKSRADAAKSMADSGVNPDDPQTMMLKIQEMLATIQKTWAQGHLAEAQAVYTETETALLPHQAAHDASIDRATTLIAAHTATKPEPTPSAQ
jgi:hypothetical protein